MRSACTWTLFAVAFFFSATALAKPHSALKPLLKKGNSWTFERTLLEPGSEPKVNTEIWTVDSTESIGQGATKVIIIIKEMVLPYERFTEVEYVIKGNKFYDISWLERHRPTPYFSVEELADRIPLFDAKKASKRAEVTRYKDNALAFVRYEKLSKFKANNGKSYSGVIHSMRNRGDTDPTDQWWIHPRNGIIQIELDFPIAGGGGKMTWKRIK
jgi:hypothetical protein